MNEKAFITGRHGVILNSLDKPETSDSTGAKPHVTSGVPNLFLLVGSDSRDIDDLHVAAHDICRRRLQKKVWPLYRSTRNRAAIGAGDECLIYLGGSGKEAQHVIAVATVDTVQEATASAD